MIGEFDKELNAAFKLEDDGRISEGIKWQNEILAKIKAHNKAEAESHFTKRQYSA